MKRLLLILLTLNALALSAKVQVEARIDSIQMFIGQQAHVTVQATAGQSQAVVLPTFQPQQQIAPGVEIVEQGERQEEPIDGGMTRHSQQYTVTSFDAALYYLPPFTVSVDGKEYKTKSLALKVLGIEVDTVHVDQFCGPKGVQDNPFLWSEWAVPFWLGVMLMLLIILDFIGYLRLRNGRPIMSTPKVVKRLLPHQKAMKEIEQLKAERMPSSGDQKLYYTRLTEAIRRYIDERFGFNAMEMTSFDIIERLRGTGDAVMLDELRELFQTADLVKFAKYSTLINENDRNLMSAVEFIGATKLDKPIEPEKPAVSREEVQKRVRYRSQEIAVGVVAVGCVCLLIYIVWSVSQLLM